MAVARAGRTQNAGPRLGRTNCEAEDKYNKLKNFRLEINIFKMYNTPQTEKLSIAKNWLDRKGLLIIESLTQMEKERCNTMKGIFTAFNNKFKPQFNETIKPLQFHKLSRQTKENTEEWMGRLRLAAVECKYREVDRQLKDHFIHRLNDNDMLTEIIKELTKAEESADITSEQVLG